MSNRRSVLSLVFLLTLSSLAAQFIPKPIIETEKLAISPDFPTTTNEPGWVTVTGTLNPSEHWTGNKVTVYLEEKNYYSETSTAQTISLIAPSRKKFSLSLPVTEDTHTISYQLRVGGAPIRGTSKDLQINRNYYSDSLLRILYVSPKEYGSPYYIQQLNTGTGLTTNVSPLPRENGLSSNWEYYGANINEVKVVQITAEELPDHWYGYDQVDLVVLNNDKPFEELAKKQSFKRRALLRWVEMGGTVLVSPGNDFWLRKSVFLQDLFQTPLTESVEQAGPNFFSSTNMVIFKHPKRHDLESSGVTWWMEKGYGTVLYSGRDLGKMGGDALDIWRQYLVRNIPHQSYLDKQRNFDVDVTRKLDISRKATPAFWAITICLAFYLFVIGPLNFFHLKRRRKTIFLLFTIPLISVLFAGFILSYGYITKGTYSKLLSLQILHQIPDSDYSYEKCYAGIFSGSRDLYQIEARPGSVVEPMFFRNRERSGQNFVYRQQPSLQLQDYPLSLWQMGYFQSDNLVKTGFLRASVNLSRLSVDLEKKEALPLNKPLIVFTSKDNKGNAKVYSFDCPLDKDYLKQAPLTRVKGTGRIQDMLSVYWDIPSEDLELLNLAISYENLDRNQNSYTLRSEDAYLIALVEVPDAIEITPTPGIHRKMQILVVPVMKEKK